ncbi:carboxylesterase/lipase family protein [Kutzneria kofuensis]|uniref:Carboxylic ester hydrolase n=1 Tax=Kutzneria kofuensis TaxID=103725 RepID=A0A7W9KQP1_9PSEU|nr:carboxylesterase family protein [Kutzneria kofuensis]MBB5896970.1 para-nitrobenzyl esterase [Kutzneria kofuensis]
MPKLLALSVLTALLTGATPCPADPALVTTTDGPVHGTVGADYRSFQGIPYAAPPVGALRWRPPAPVQPWTQPRDATKPGNACPQAPGEPRTDEDCLYLDVTTPRHDTGRLPVMVWIHGGSFIAGAGTDIDARSFADKAHAIVVTINYRLGVLGFLAHPALDAESGDQSGDYGIQDQQAALRWVKANAAAFGGDPGNVTLFGQSAGGASVCMNLASPGAAGLFERAITESGGCVAPQPDKTIAERNGAALATQLGCTDLDCLRGKTPEQLLAAANAIPYSPTYSWHPVWGGSVIPVKPAVAFYNGQFNRVPLLVSSNRDESTILIAQQYPNGITEQQYEQLQATVFKADAAQVLAHYPGGDNPTLAFARSTTDWFFSCTSLATDQFASGFVPTYADEFADETAPGDPYPLYPLGAYHGSELQYLFGGTLSPAQQALADRMIGYWSRFAWTGDPNGPGLPTWPRFHPGDRIVPAFAPGRSMTVDLGTEHQCDFWNGLARQGG